jgi:DNA-binding transcriptional ArsR family regulator
MPESGAQRVSGPPIESIVRRCRALSDPIRIPLLNALRDGSASIDELQQVTGSSERDVSEQLNVLVDAGLVSQVPTGGFWRYVLAAGDLLAPCREHGTAGGARTHRAIPPPAQPQADSPARLRRQRGLQAQIAQYIHELAS